MMLKLNPGLYTVTEETLWHASDGDTIVPAGESVDVVRLDDVPRDERAGIETNLRYKLKKMEQDWVPVRVRDWYAILPVTMLSPKGSTQCNPNSNPSPEANLLPFQLSGEKPPPAKASRRRSPP